MPKLNWLKSTSNIVFVICRKSCILNMLRKGEVLLQRKNYKSPKEFYKYFLSAHLETKLKSTTFVQHCIQSLKKKI